MADLSDNTNWFETDASNNKASPNGWPEGMMPSGVNDTARADKGALKRFWDKINPVQPIAVSGGVWTFATSNIAYPTAYVNGEIYRFSPQMDGVGGDQFQVNSLGPKPIWKRFLGGSGYTPIIAGDITGGVMPELLYLGYLNGGSGAFLLLNPYVPVNGDGAGGFSINGAVTSNVAGTAFYAPNGNLVCENITAAGSSGDLAITCPNGGIESDFFGTAFYAPNGNFVGTNITLSGNGFKPGGGAWSATSDVRLKRDIKDYKTGLKAILALRPVTYNFNGRGGTTADGSRFVGLVADEVLPVMPEMVGTISELLDLDDETPSEIKTLDTTALIFALVNCCQELAARITTLETDVRD